MVTPKLAVAVLAASASAVTLTSRAESASGSALVMQASSAVCAHAVCMQRAAGRATCMSAKARIEKATPAEYDRLPCKLKEAVLTQA